MHPKDLLGAYLSLTAAAVREWCVKRGGFAGAAVLLLLLLVQEVTTLLSRDLKHPIPSMV